MLKLMMVREGDVEDRLPARFCQCRHDFIF